MLHFGSCSNEALQEWSALIAAQLLTWFIAASEILLAYALQVA